jgi:hypothetical protein
LSFSLKGILSYKEELGRVTHFFKINFFLLAGVSIGFDSFSLLYTEPFSAVCKTCRFRDPMGWTIPIRENDQTTNQFGWKRNIGMMMMMMDSSNLNHQPSHFVFCFFLMQLKWWSMGRVKAPIFYFIYCVFSSSILFYILKVILDFFVDVVFSIFMTLRRTKISAKW